MLGTILALCVVAFLTGICIGVTLRIYWVWFIFGLACTILGATLMLFALWWLGADFSTIDWARLTAGADLLTVSLAFNTLFCFLFGFWVGYTIVGTRISSYVVAGVSGRRV